MLGIRDADFCVLGLFVVRSFVMLGIPFEFFFGFR